MAGKLRALSDDDLVIIGRRHGSPDVGLEANESSVRWKRDLGDLTPYGFGRASLAKFIELIGRHGAACTARPQAVGAKTTAIEHREEVVGEGWEFVEQVSAALSLPATANGGLANDLNAAVPADTAALAAGIGAVAGVLAKYKSLVDAEFPADAMVERAPVLAEAVTREIGGAAMAKSAPMSDTRDIDLLDGKVVTIIRRLNKAGRKAYRRLRNDVKVAEYRYQHLEQRKVVRQAKPATPPTP